MLKKLRDLPLRRKKQGAGVLALLVVYSALGLLAAPTMINKVAVNYVRDKLHLDLSLGRVEFNPWNLALRLDAVSVREPEGEVLLFARSLYLNANGLASLWQRQLAVDDVDWLGLHVNAHINPAGELNLMKLLPPEDTEDSSETPWHLAALSVRQGQVDLLDESRPEPFSTKLAPLNLQLFNLSSGAAGDGKYRFNAETAKGERLAWSGRVGLNPLGSEGNLQISGLQAATVGEYAQDLLPVRITGGQLAVSADYRWRVEQGRSLLTLSRGQMELDDLQAETQAKKPLLLTLAKLRIRDLDFAWPSQDMRLPELSIEGVGLGDISGSLLTLKRIGLQEASWMPSKDQASLGEASLDEMKVLDGASDLITVSALKVAGMSLSPSAQRLATGRVQLGAGSTRVIRYPEGDFNWERSLANMEQRLIRSAPTAVSSNAGLQPGKPWALTLGEFRVGDFRIDAEDRVPRQVVRLPLYITQLSVHPELDLKKPHRFEGDVTLGQAARLRMDGHLEEGPFNLDTRLRLEGFTLPPLAPYLADYARFRLESGKLDLDGRLQVQEGKQLQVAYQGGLGISGFAANDQFLQERFLAWKRLQLNGMDVSLTPMRVKVKEMVADQPFTRLMILPDKSVNFAQILAATPIEAKSPSRTGKALPAGRQESTPVDIARILVRNGSLLFADLSLKPQFATGIESLVGDIRDVSTRAGTVAGVALTGRVDQYGKAEIRGRINPLAPDERTDMSLRFDNVELTTLTPYAAKFAGYRIDKGKLSLDLNYHIEDRQLRATNKIVLNQLALGEKVDSPDAVSMPLRLALALLKDKNGVIDIDLPVTGSLDDPQFRVGPIIWKAFVNVITKVATAPFRFIAGLVGGGEDMDSLPFAPGESDLRPEAVERLRRLADAMQMRPQLKIELRGAHDSVRDGRVLQDKALQDAIRSRMASAGSELKALETLFVEKLGGEALKQQKALAMRPAGQGQDLVLSEAALRTALKAALMEKEVVAEGDLRQLALDRSRGLRQWLVEQGKLDESRIFVLEPEAGKAEGDWVISRVSLNAL